MHGWGRIFYLKGVSKCYIVLSIVLFWMLAHFTDVKEELIQLKAQQESSQTYKIFCSYFLATTNNYEYRFTAKLIRSKLFAWWWISTATSCFHVVPVSLCATQTPNMHFSTQSEKKWPSSFRAAKNKNIPTTIKCVAMQRTSE